MPAGTLAFEGVAVKRLWFLYLAVDQKFVSSMQNNNIESVYNNWELNRKRSLSVSIKSYGNTIGSLEEREKPVYGECLHSCFEVLQNFQESSSNFI